MFSLLNIHGWLHRLRQGSKYHHLCKSLSFQCFPHECFHFFAIFFLRSIEMTSQVEREQLWKGSAETIVNGARPHLLHAWDKSVFYSFMIHNCRDFSQTKDSEALRRKNSCLSCNTRRIFLFLFPKSFEFLLS